MYTNNKVTNKRKHSEYSKERSISFTLYPYCLIRLTLIGSAYPKLELRGT